MWRRAVAGLVRLVRPAYLRTRHAVIELFFERPHGLDTNRIVRLADLGLPSENRVDYRPSGWLTLRRILKPAEVSPRDVFVDFGSGAGRVVIEAARYPFAAVIGVELAPELHRTAQENVARAAETFSAQRVELVNSDVLEFAIPEELTVAYFYNPFTGPIFQGVLDRLLASLERHPRRLRVIYLNPVEERRLLAAGARRVRRVRGLRPSAAWSASNSIALYELGPAGRD
jgi:SAM-dependent methyltransferase